MSDGQPLYSSVHPVPKQSWLSRILWPIKIWWWSKTRPRSSSLELVTIESMKSISAEHERGLANIFNRSGGIQP